LISTHKNNQILPSPNGTNGTTGRITGVHGQKINGLNMAGIMEREETTAHGGMVIINGDIMVQKDTVLGVHGVHGDMAVINGNIMEVTRVHGDTAVSGDIMVVIEDTMVIMVEKDAVELSWLFPLHSS